VLLQKSRHSSGRLSLAALLCAKQVHRRGRGVAVPYMTLVLAGMGGHCLVPAAVATGKRTTKHSTVGWVGLGVKSEWVQKISPPRAFEPWTVQSVASEY
jgi:hypothetical protein